VLGLGSVQSRIIQDLLEPLGIVNDAFVLVIVGLA
jgi:hypothetical protein